jgi:urease accessory protein
VKSAAAEPPRPGLRGHLRLVCAHDGNGRSFLQDQSVAVPMHVSKSFWDGDVLVVQVINPTAGLLAGDFIESEIAVQSGAALLVTTPSATRVHDTQAGEACVEQTFSVAAGGRLEVWPEILIPQQGARYRQKTRIDLEAGAELFFMEALAPGRVASGEVFAFGQLDWETEIVQNGTKIVRERFRIDPNNGSLDALRAAFHEAYQATLFLVSDQVSDDASCWKELRQLHDQDFWLGSSRLCQGGWVVKMLARDSLVLRSRLEIIRHAIRSCAGWAPSVLRKI